VPRLSPDGRRVALDTRDQQNDIWIWDFERRVLTRLTTDPSSDFYPVWSPDGRRIVFASQRAGQLNLFSQPADGTGTAERLTTSATAQAPLAFTPDGKSLVLRDGGAFVGANTGVDLAIMPLGGDRAVKPLIHTTYNETNADLSPDGRWLAYQSNESGRDEIHVRPFPAVDSGHWQVSTDGGTRPVWARNGRELFFVDANGRIVAVAIQSGSGFTAANPVVAVEAASFTGGTTPGRYYDVSPDGRFLVIRASTTTATPSTSQLNVVLNWGEELERLAPAKR
jgi:Tol biopolymer transport system component